MQRKNPNDLINYLDSISSDISDIYAIIVTNNGTHNVLSTSHEMETIAKFSSIVATVLHDKVERSKELI